MKILFLAAAMLALTPAASFAIDSASLAVTQNYKPRKLMTMDDVSTLMRGADYWCYGETSDGCDWSERYLDVNGKTASYEVSNAWDDTRNISFTDEAEIRGGKICENGYDWIPSTYGQNRQTGEPVIGRELAAIKVEMRGNSTSDELNCFDYLMGSVDGEAGTITVTQRQYDQDGNTDPADDAIVTLHYDTTDAPIPLLDWEL